MSKRRMACLKTLLKCSIILTLQPKKQPFWVVFLFLNDKKHCDIRDDMLAYYRRVIYKGGIS